jgi:hypothetical protein
MRDVLRYLKWLVLIVGISSVLMLTISYLIVLNTNAYQSAAEKVIELERQGEAGNCEFYFSPFRKFSWGVGGRGGGSAVLTFCPRSTRCKLSCVEMKLKARDWRWAVESHKFVD